MLPVAIFLGDISERISVLEEAGQLSLAWVTATVCGLDAASQRISTALLNQNIALPRVPVASKLIVPPRPVVQCVAAWPEVEVEEDVFAEAVRNAQESKSADDQDCAKFGDENLDELMDSQHMPSRESEKNNLVLTADDDDTLEQVEGSDGGWGFDEDLDLDDDICGMSGGADGSDHAGTQDDGSDFYVSPELGIPQSQEWIKSPLAADHVAAKFYRTAMRLLNRQVGIVDFDSLKSAFLLVSQSTHMTLSGIPGTTSVPCAVVRNLSDTSTPLPRVAITLRHLVDDYKLAKRMFGKNELQTSLLMFRSVFARTPLLVVDSTSDEKLVRELMGSCKAYIMGIRIETARRAARVEGNIGRALELSCYLTHVELDNTHKAQMGLKPAMLSAFKARNFITAEGFARRLLEMNIPAKVRKIATKVVQKSQQDGRNALLLDYNSRIEIEICGASLRPIAPDTEGIKCPYCMTCYEQSATGTICSACAVARVGVQTLGLTCLLAQ